MIVDPGEKDSGNMFTRGQRSGMIETVEEFLHDQRWIFQKGSIREQKVLYEIRIIDRLMFVDEQVKQLLGSSLDWMNMVKWDECRSRLYLDDDFPRYSFNLIINTYFFNHDNLFIFFDFTDVFFPLWTRRNDKRRVNDRFEWKMILLDLK